MMFEIEEESVDPLESSESATSIIADNINRRFPSDNDSNSFNNSLRIDIDGQHSIPLPTEVQRSLCLNATSTLAIDIIDSGDDLSPIMDQSKLCLCASINRTETQEQGQRSRKSSHQGTTFPCHTHAITEDYVVSHEIIGIGESGKVMACYSKDKNEKFALKVLRDGPKARREVGLHYLTNAHENVVTILDIYENTFDDVKCLLMVVEFLEGGDLLSQFEKQGSKPYSEKKVGEIIRQIGSAVQYLHDMNIAHRDIKLENILCSSTGDDCVYKLGDYGFAKRPERNVLMESPCCTPFYAPPEVLSRERYDKSCDMWSLGVAMYILLCGYPPFYSMKGVALSPGMRNRIAKGYYAFPAEEWDHVSQSTKDDIRCLLRTDPTERMTIHTLMNTPLVTGQKQPEGIPILGASEEEDDDKVLHDPVIIPRSVRFLRDGVKAPRLHSIQEEVGRALELMRLGGEPIPLINYHNSCNSFIGQRTAHLSIPKIQC